MKKRSQTSNDVKKEIKKLIGELFLGNIYLK